MEESKIYTNVIRIKTIFGKHCKVSEESILSSAKDCIESRFAAGEVLTSSSKTREYLKVLIGEFEREVFYVLWLNNQHQVIEHGVLFQGTLDGSAVYPREVVKAGLSCNAAACIFAHNHPSGMNEPSQADKAITKRLQDALAIVDIRTLDHMIVGKSVASMAELGLI